MASDGDFDEGDLWEEDKASPHRRPAHELHGDSSGSEDDGAFPGARPHRAEPSPGALCAYPARGSWARRPFGVSAPRRVPTPCGFGTLLRS